MHWRPMQPRWMQHGFGSLALLALVFALGPGCGERSAELPAPAEDPISAARAAIPAEDWARLVAGEELLHGLVPALRDLERSVRNLRLPDPRARERFALVVRTVDLAEPGEARPLSGLPVEVSVLPAGPSVESAPASLDLWRPLLGRLDHVTTFSLGVLEGRFLDPERRRFRTKLAASGAGRDRDGSAVAFEGRLDLVWERLARDDPGDPKSWRIAGFESGPQELQRAPDLFFEEVLDAALGPAAAAGARRSRHEELVLARLLDPEGFEPPHEHFFQGAQDRHPGVAVADVNGDGHDDLYVMARWGPNRLFVARGDGGFEERAGSLGLDLVDHSAAAVFADLDNDGDADVFVGRTLAESRLLWNEGGRFVPAGPEAIEGGPLPSLVGSVSAADVDGDGLLDLYVSTYAAQMIVREVIAAEQARRLTGAAWPETLLADRLAPDDARALLAEVRRAGSHQYLSLPGPPNVLLRNQGGGRFRVARDAGPLVSLRNTYQATWSDFDRDGDPDVYLAHDFAPNQLLRNDGEAGFTDVTEQTGTADIGFGMGASFGDYDGDGRLDLYVSNMYSKAGRRITAALEGVDPRFEKMARGNTLFRNLGDRFESVSGLEPPALEVEAAGWSWGGQFGDVDRDGFPDLHVLAGYYTAPLEAHVDVDI